MDVITVLADCRKILEMCEDIKEQLASNSDDESECSQRKDVAEEHGTVPLSVPLHQDSIAAEVPSLPLHQDPPSLPCHQDSIAAEVPSLPLHQVPPSVSLHQDSIAAEVPSLPLHQDPPSLPCHQDSIAA